MHRYMSAEATLTFCFFTQPMPQCHNSHTTTVTMQLKAPHGTIIIYDRVYQRPQMSLLLYFETKCFQCWAGVTPMEWLVFSLPHITPYYPPMIPPKVFNVGLEQSSYDKCPQMYLFLIFWDERFSMLGWSDGGITALCAAIQQPKAIEKVLCHQCIVDLNMLTISKRKPLKRFSARPYDSWSQDFPSSTDAGCCVGQQCLPCAGGYWHDQTGSHNWIQHFIINALWYNEWKLANSFILMVQVEDVSNWSARMRQPMEAVYGVEGFPKLWFETW